MLDSTRLRLRLGSELSLSFRFEHVLVKTDFVVAEALQTGRRLKPAARHLDVFFVDGPVDVYCF